MVAKNKVLIVDGVPNNRIALKKILDDDYNIVEAENGQQALDILEAQTERDTIAAVLLDLALPELGGYQFLQKYQKIETYRRIPVIVAMGKGDLEAERKCLELGAWDFVRKPFDSIVLCFRIRNVIERSHLQLSRELKYRADYDTLTGIYNKSKFFETTKILLGKHSKERFAFLRMDVAKFQLVNTFFGICEGDKLLCYIAEELRLFAGESTRISYGRVEADIFCICIPYQSKQTILELIRYIRTRMACYNLEYNIVPTIGIYIIDDHDLPMDRMYDRANLAAKKCKGNYVCNYAFYTPDMSEELFREQRIVNSMRNALKNEEFVLYLQPKYDLQDNSIKGAEVLVRWNSPTNGMISPGEFIPILERNGFITKLDYYVWEKTCQLLAKWLKEEKKIEPLSVNISRISLYNPKLVEIICGLAEQYQIPPRLLQLELTESAYTNNPEEIREQMEKFQNAGFSILMDDFGSGYSSLNVLKDIAVDILKIDMKFLSDTDRQGRSENILASVVRMAKWLDMPVIAEGVERREQVDFLRSIGCEYVQGYYFAKPMPVEEYEKLAFGEKRRVCKERETHLDLNADSLWTATSQMEILFSNMLQAVAVYEYEDDKGVLDIIRVNNAYYDLFGYSDINHIQKNLLTSVGEEGRNILKSAFREVVETKEMTDCEFMRRLESGRWIWIQLRLKYINQVGKKHVIFGMISDITEQKAVDRELKKYRRVFTSERNEKKTILVVDDTEANRISARCIFEEKYYVLEAENGKEALEYLKEHPGEVDIILLDLMMPVMDGAEFLKCKQTDAASAGIPVIVITSDDTTRQQAQVMELGADDYIVKPFIPEIAVRRVHNVLEAQKRLGDTLKKYRKILKQQKDVAQLDVKRRDKDVKALMIVELNNLSEIADAYTFKIAEQLTTVVEERLKHHFTQTNVIHRCDRREFIVSFTEHISCGNLKKQCNTLLKEIVNINVDGFRLECSIGAAVTQDEETEILTLMEKADKALYLALQTGKNQFIVV